MANANELLWGLISESGNPMAARVIPVTLSAFGDLVQLTGSPWIVSDTGGAPFYEANLASNRRVSTGTVYNATTAIQHFEWSAAEKIRRFHIFNEDATHELRVCFDIFDNQFEQDILTYSTDEKIPYVSIKAGGDVEFVFPEAVLRLGYSFVGGVGTSSITVRAS